ncbi:hypothetical protein [Enterococcus cecorum]|uniref:hypothetical protein n=1 Tax=Enterococcus cecorum TaxID=44008 RepID=UPI000642A8F4|nr:hypothetical protein [Enterococcus cecorum]
MEMQKSNNKRILIILVIFILIVSVPILINVLYKYFSGDKTLWDASDLLSYYGTVISAMGTIILGYIAWKQNERLLALEESSFLTENSVISLLEEINIKDINGLACNLDNHLEQVVITNDALKEIENNYASISIICKIKPMNNMKHIPVVHVENISIIRCQISDKVDSYIHAREFDKKYSNVAMSRCYDQFQITILLSKNEKEDLLNSLRNRYGSLVIEMELFLLTEKYVETKLKCRATLQNYVFDENKKIFIVFKRKKDKDNEIQCFWYGSYLKNKQEVVIKSIIEEES